MAGFGQGLSSGLLSGLRLGSVIRERRQEDKDRRELEEIEQAGMSAWGMNEATQPQQAQPSDAARIEPVQTPGMRMSQPTGALAVQSTEAPQFDTAERPMPAPAETAMPRAQEPDDLTRMNRSLRAMSAKAAEKGNARLALKYHIEGMKVRDQLRQKAADTARVRYEATGDASAFVPFFNEYNPDPDTQFDSIVVQGDRAVLTGAVGGQRFEQAMPVQQFRQMLEFATDPQAARALEAQQAERLFELRKEQEKNRFQKVAPGETIIDTGSGSSFTTPKEHVVKDAEGNESIQVYGDAPATGASNVIPKAVTAMQKDAANAVFKLNGVSDLSGLTPDQEAKVARQQNLASNLIAANYGTDAWRGLSAARAATIAHAIESGEERMVHFDPKDGGAPVPGVIFEGRKYLLDPHAGGRFRRTRSSTGASSQQFDAAAQQVGMTQGMQQIARAIFAQESSSGAADTDQPNNANARGPMQVTQETFAGLQRDGIIPKDFRWDNPEHSMVAGLALVKHLYQKYAGDPRKIAAAYYSGEKAVQGDTIRDLRDPKNARAPSTRQYVDQVVGRLG